MSRELDPLQSLVALGLTSLEADVYAHLLVHAPATGYRVAKALGKPTPNVYKAIESLQEKGAVDVDEGRVRRCRAVPVEELLARLEREFQRHRREASDALARLQPAAEDTRVYELKSREQVLERARSMLAAAQQIVLVDAFPAPLRAIQEDIGRACRRGIEVAAKVYAPHTLEVAEVVMGPDPEVVRARWPVDWFNVVADGAQMLLALLERDGDGVVQAIWSSSPSLAWIMHNTFASELNYSVLADVLEREGGVEEIRSAYERMRRVLAPEAPGYFRLLRHLGLSVPGAASSTEERP